jgi:hypothetical protein
MISRGMLHLVLHEIEIMYISCRLGFITNGKEIEQELATRDRRTD